MFSLAIIGVIEMNLLEGIKVVDFSKWLPGQYCGMLLGDYGADVIKIDLITSAMLISYKPLKIFHALIT